MKKINYAVLVCALFIFGMFSFSVGIQNAAATVGGPTFISSLAFNAQNNSVYYTVHDGGGKGCPPVIRMINLNTLADTPVKSCDELIKGPWSEIADQNYIQFRNETYQNLKYLGSVSLKKNNIDVQVETLSQHTAEDGYVLWNEFRATITQYNKKVGEINFRGCSKDQPHVFEGYMIPNSNAMAILISNKRGCYEGGYISESLHMIKGITYYDTDIVRSYKEIGATEPNMGNLVVYAEGSNAGHDTNNEPTDEVTPKNSEKNSAARILIPTALFVVGLGLGYALHKKSAPTTPKI